MACGYGRAHRRASLRTGRPGGVARRDRTGAASPLGEPPLRRSSSPRPVTLQPTIRSWQPPRRSASSRRSTSRPGWRRWPTAAPATARSTLRSCRFPPRCSTPAARSTRSGDPAWRRPAPRPASAGVTGTGAGEKALRHLQACCEDVAGRSTPAIKSTEVELQPEREIAVNLTADRGVTERDATPDNVDRSRSGPRQAEGQGRSQNPRTSRRRSGPSMPSSRCCGMAAKTSC